MAELALGHSFYGFLPQNQKVAMAPGEVGNIALCATSGQPSFEAGLPTGCWWYLAGSKIWAGLSERGSRGPTDLALRPGARFLSDNPAAAGGAAKNEAVDQAGALVHRTCTTTGVVTTREPNRLVLGSTDVTRNMGSGSRWSDGNEFIDSVGCR